MTSSIDTCHFRDLAGKNSEDVCENALCGYDRNRDCYTLSVWSEEYGIYPADSKIIRIRDGKSDINTFLGLFIVHYLLTSKAVPVSKEWVSVKDMPGGDTFFRGPHAIPTYLIEKRYGDNLAQFLETCEQLHGMPLDMGDKAYSFRVAPRIPVGVLLWKGDDEFPAESKMLFDRTIIEHLALDIIFAVAVEICTRIAEFPANVTKRG